MLNKADVGTRLGAMFIDHVAMTVIVVLFSLPEIVLGAFDIFFSGFDAEHGQDKVEGIGPGHYLSLVGFALYFCKDSLNGRSLAKRILRLQVVNHHNDNPASPLRCFVRNIFCILWPVEMIVALINPERRLGDRVANTRVIRYDSSVEKPKIDYRMLAFSVVLAYGFILLVFWPFNLLTSSIFKSQPMYVESTINDQEGIEMENLLSLGLGESFSPDVRVYDQTVDNPDLKYVSVILLTPTDDTNNHDIKNKVEEIILSRYPGDSFKGRIKLVYRSRWHKSFHSYRFP